MDRFNSLIIGLFCALGLGLSGYFIGYSLQRFSGNNKHITVRGIGERSVKANHATWSIEFSVVEPTMAQAMNSVRKTTTTIKEFLTEHQFTDAEISIRAPQVSLQDMDKVNGISKKVTVTGEVFISTDNVDKTQQAFANMFALFEKGVMLKGWNTAPSYSIKNFDALRPALLEEATKSANGVAERFANAAGVQVGSVKELHQGVFTVVDEDSGDGSGAIYGPSSKAPSYNKVVRVVVNVTYGIK